MSKINLIDDNDNQTLEIFETDARLDEVDEIVQAVKIVFGSDRQTEHIREAMKRNGFTQKNIKVHEVLF